MRNTDNGIPPVGGSSVGSAGDTFAVESGGGRRQSGSLVRNRGESRGESRAAGPGFAGAAAPPPAGFGGRAPSLPRERKPAMAALGVLLVVLGVLASVYLQQRSQDRVGVVEITQTVPGGQPVLSADIAQVMVAVDPSIHYVTWNQRLDLLSHYSAATTLVPGTLLMVDMITTASPIPAGDEIAGVSLKDGEYPDGIQAGDTVTGYYVSNKNGDSTGLQYLGDGFTVPPIFAKVQVYSVNQLGSSGSVDVSLILPQVDVNAAVQAASGGNLVLVFDKHTPQAAG